MYACSDAIYEKPIRLIIIPHLALHRGGLFGSTFLRSYSGLTRPFGRKGSVFQLLLIFLSLIAVGTDPATSYLNKIMRKRRMPVAVGNVVLSLLAVTFVSRSPWPDDREMSSSAECSAFTLAFSLAARYCRFRLYPLAVSWPIVARFYW